MGFANGTMELKMKSFFTEFFSKISEIIGWLVIVPAGLIIGSLGLLQIVGAVLVPAWLLWEFWPFGNELSQKLAYTETVETKSAVMKKINVIEFELNIDQQRVIQKIVAPIQGDRGRPLLCSYFGEICQDDDASDEAENLGFREILQILFLCTSL